MQKALRQSHAPRVEIFFGDLITADYLVLNEESESRNRHRYAVIVLDVATQWVHTYPSKTKTSQETEMSLQQFLEQKASLKVIDTDNLIHWNLAEPAKIDAGIIVLHRLILLRQNRIAERAVRTLKEGTSAILLQFGLVEKW